MTMPHLMNCAHLDDGWCLECVGVMHATLDARTTRITELERAFDGMTERNNALAAEVDARTAERDEARASNAESTRLMQDASATIESMRAALATEKVRADDATYWAASFGRDVAILRDEAARLRTENNALRERLRATEDRRM